MKISDLIGIAPELRKLLIDTVLLNGSAMSGDLILRVTPDVLGSSAADVNAAIAGDGFTRDVLVELVNTAGDIHTWFNGTFAVAATKTGAGAVAMGNANVTLSQGAGVCTITYTGAWVEGNAATVTVTGGTKLGYAVANETSIDTLIA